MQDQQHPDWIRYSVLIQSKITEIFEENEGLVKELLDDEEKIKAFFHALSTVVPCHIYNGFYNETKNHVEFNHTANLLCFQFVEVHR